MSDLKDEDLLLGDDIDDQALYGADEDELLLTDEELEKDVTNEEKQQIKAEAEQWVREKIQEQHKRPQRNTKTNGASNSTKKYNSETLVNTKNAPVATTDVSSTANGNNSTENVVAATAVPISQGVHSTSETAAQCESKDSKATIETRTVSQTQGGADSQSPCKLVQNLNKKPYSIATNADDTISSSSKDIDVDHMSLISCSTSELVTDSSIIPSSQESITTGVSVSGASRDFNDPREDCDDEREERTNIKTTNEREVESASSSDQSPDVHPRYGQNKRIPGDGPHSMIRPHRYSARLPFHTGPPRGMLNRGVYPPMPHGHFPPQHPASNTPPHNMYASPTATHSTQQQTHGGLPPSPSNPMNSVPPSHEMMPRMPLRHPYPGFRANAPIPNMGGNYRHPVHGNAYNPHDYNGNGPNHGPSPYGQNFLPNPPVIRGMFRPEIPQGMQPRLPPPPGLRMQRAPLQQHNLLPGSSAFPPNVPQNTVRPQITPQQSAQGGLPNVGTNPPNAANLPHGVPGTVPSATPTPPVRPSKVLINPNFKGGVEAATSKFIQETQYMAAIGGVPRSDDELLRQQEEFINKNRQHIEKRRHERAVSPTARRSSRSRSRSRTRSRSRERSYSPPSKRTGVLGGGDRHFERERDRERDRDRDRERERGGVARDRGGQIYGSRAGGNRFRRGNSRDRGGPGDYDSRGGNSGSLNNYNKRRRSVSPSGNRGSGNMMGGRRRSGDRDRNEEDDETRAYRLQIEKQKELREKIMRDKEMKRRRAAEEKQHEEKRGTTQSSNSNQTSSQTSKTSNNNNNSNSSPRDEPQKLKPIIVTQPKIISLKKRQQQNDLNNERQKQRSTSPPSGPQPRRQLPTAKILPEAKRTLTEHLTSAGSGGSSSGFGGHSSNTAIIKPVQKTRETSKTQTPPLPPPNTMTTSSSSLPSKHTRRLSTPSDDEVQLDYDDDELMLDEEERLLATPTPSPKHRTSALSRTPSPESPLPIKSSRNKSQKMSTTSSGMSFSSNNRRVVLKQSNERSGTKSPGGRIRRGNSRHRDAGNNSGSSSQSSRKGIFDRLDVRNSGNNGSGAGSESKRKAHRIVLKHD